MKHDVSTWTWYGKAGHLIVGNSCLFHLCTEIGPWLVSTVGEYKLEAAVRDVMRKAGIPNRPEDPTVAPWLRENCETIGLDRYYETMVFRFDGRCPCGCGQPNIIPTELEMRGYNDPKAATVGHLAACLRWAERGEDWKEAGDEG